MNVWEVKVPVGPGTMARLLRSARNAGCGPADETDIFFTAVPARAAFAARAVVRVRIRYGGTPGRVPAAEAGSCVRVSAGVPGIGAAVLAAFPGARRLPGNEILVSPEPGPGTLRRLRRVMAQGGCRCRLTVRKRRFLLRQGKAASAVLDMVEGLGAFVEIRLSGGRRNAAVVRARRHWLALGGRPEEYCPTAAAYSQMVLMARGA